MKPAEYIGQMGPKHASIGVKLINDNKLQICKNKIESEFTVIRQKCPIHHLRVGQNNIRFFPDPAPLARGCVAVVNSRRNAALSEIFNEWLDRAVLITGQRLRRIDEDRPRQRIP